LLITTISMRNDASAMSGTLTCGKSEHEHTEDCYTLVPESITCGMVEHVHEDSCFDVGWELDCNEDHEHGVDCYKEVVMPICGLEEHTHDDSCVTPEHYELTCGKEAHVHGDTCYTKDDSIFDTIQNLAYGQPKDIVSGDDTYTVTLQYENKSDARQLPNLVTREITEEDDEYAGLLEQARQQYEGETIYARFFEITPLQKDFEEGEPKGDTTVTVTLNDYQEITDDTSVSVLHFTEDSPSEIASEVVDDQALTVTFTTDGFSTFGIIYTVDFHNGANYQFSIPGGGYVTLQQLVEVLGIADTYYSDDASGNAASNSESSQDKALLTLADVQISDKTRQFVADVEKIEFSNPELVWIGKIEHESTVGGLKESHGLECQYSAELTEEQIAEINSQTVNNDWILISLKSFTTTEVLTITMKNNDVVVVNISDEATSSPQYTLMDRSAFTENRDGKENTDEGIIVKLFDYEGWMSNGKTIDSQWGNTNYSLYRDGSGVNNGRTLIFSGSGISGGSEYWNTFTGSKPNETNYIFYSGYRQADIVAPKLVNNYPVLNDKVTKYGNDDGSLGYLFGAGGQDGVTAYTNGGKGLNGLLRKDSDGYYYYSSEDNYARFNGSDYIDLYTDTYFKDKGEVAKENNGFGAIGFFPFTDYNPSSKEEKGPNGSIYNHQLGMSMEAYFTYPPNGRLNDGTGDPVIFEFSGDDDIWVFVDDTLVLDLGGVHQPIRGVIDFEKQEVYITEFDSYGYKDTNPKKDKTTTIPFSTFFGSDGFDSTEYSTHKFNFFFIERGGCDSNCTLKFNFMTLQTAEKTFYKYDKDGNKPLAGATFAVYRDAECTEALTINKKPLTATSAEDGSVKLIDIPVRRDSENQAYPFYMKETVAPAGYDKIPTIYKLVYNEEEGTYDIIPPGEDAEPIEIIYNEKKEIQLTLQKEWVGDPPSNATATFQLKRFMSYTGEIPLEKGTIKVHRIGYDSDTGTWDVSKLITRTEEYAGNSTASVNWSYNSYYGSEWPRWAYYVGDVSNGYLDKQNASNTVEVYLPAGETVDVYICDGNVNTQYEQYGVENIVITGQPYDPTATVQATVSEKEDASFTGDGLTKTLPDADTGWTWEFPKQDSAAIIDDIVVTYSYRIEEVNVPAGYETVYFDSQGNVVPKSNLNPLNVDESGTQTIQNIPSTSIPVDKSWGSEIDDDDSYDWSATFELESIEVHVSGPIYGGANTTQWQSVPGVEPITIRKGQSEGERSFHNLPKYIEYPTTGSLYRIVYSLDETEYKLWHNGNLESSFSKNDGLTGEDFYTPQYPHDAGDTEDGYGLKEGDENFYHIIVINHKSDEHVEELLTGLKIHKSWPDGTFDSPDVTEEDAYASFQLKRYVSKTYRTYTDESNYTDWSNYEPAEEDLVFTNEKHIYMLKKSNNWMQEANNLPKTSTSDIHENEQTVYHYTYYFEETGSYPANYAATFGEVGDADHPVEANDTTVEVVNHETVSAIVVKNWNDNNNANGNRPDSLAMTLVANGDLTGQTVTLSQENDWAYEINKLPKYNQDNEPIHYSWHEDHIPGYLQTDITNNDNVTTITNTPSTYDLTTSYVGTKSWNDLDNQYHSRIQDLDIKLYESKMDPATGQYGDFTVTSYEYEWKVDSGNDWTYCFDDISVYDDHGNHILYKAVETAPPSYSLSSSNVSNTVYNHYSINEIEQVTQGSSVEKTIPLATDIDLAYCVIRLQNSSYLIWTHRMPTDREIEQITEKYKDEFTGRVKTYVSGPGSFDVGSNSVTFAISETNAGRSVTLAPNGSEEWTNLYYGIITDENYSSGSASFTNTLKRTNVYGTKTWNIRGLTDPENPILVLTRTVEVTDNTSTTTSEPEVVTIVKDGIESNLQPKWRKSESAITFTYQDLPQYDQEGRPYQYSVTEASFTIGSGADMVTYTVVKNQDGTYTATPDKAGAPSYPVTMTVDNNGTHITNGDSSGNLEIIKVEKGHKDSDHVLSGAVFQLTRVNDDNDNNYTGSNAYQSGEQTVDATTGKTSFDNLKPGRYKLEEVESPEGYIRIETAWYFIIDSSGTVSLESSYSYASKNENADNSFFIENEPGGVLPSTGGNGTSLFYVTGGILITLAIAGFLLVAKKRAA